MPAQNNSGHQFDKRHAITLIAAVALAANRFAAYDGNYATSAGGVKDAQGVTEHAAEAGEAVSVVTGYSYLVEAEGEIVFGDYVKPGTDGKAIAGAVDEHCARALGAASAGQLVEVQIVKHQHADVEV
jgi:hypothetical protein